MVDFVISQEYFIILFWVFFLETSIILGYMINDRANRQETRQNAWNLGFEMGDYIMLFIYLGLMFFILYWVLFYVYPLYNQVKQSIIESGIEVTIPYMGLSLSFVALGLSLFVIVLNWIEKLFIGARNRNRFDALGKRLEAIEADIPMILGCRLTLSHNS